MKQFNMEIDQNSSQIEAVAVNVGEYFCIQTVYRNWTLNKAQKNFRFYTEEGKLVETAFEIISEDAENNVVVTMHYMDRFEAAAKLVLKTNAVGLAHPNIWVNVEVSNPTLICNNTAYGQKSIAPTVYQPAVQNGACVYLDSMLATNNTLSVCMGHEGGMASQIKIYDNQTLSSLFEVRNFVEKKVAPNLPVFKSAGSQILMNPDKLTLNGREVKVKELEVGGETLSVLQVI